MFNSFIISVGIFVFVANAVDDDDDDVVNDDDDVDDNDRIEEDENLDVGKLG
jgi:hypothetical protein